MTQYFSCGYARVAAYGIAKSIPQKNWTKLRKCNHSDLASQLHKRFQQRKAFAIPDVNNFIRNLRTLLPKFNQRWNPTSARTEYHSNFSQESWNKLTMEAKLTHSLQGCKGCLQSFPVVQSTFPGTLKRDKENYVKSSKNNELKKASKGQTFTTT